MPVILGHSPKFGGHSLRLPDHRLAKQVMTWIPTEDKRKRGRPRKLHL